MYVLHTLHYWPVDFRNRFNMIWVTVFILRLTNSFSSLSRNLLNESVKSLRNEPAGVFMLFRVDIACVFIWV